MNKNNYSKFKYENNFNLKYSVNPNTQQVSVLNAELRTVKPNLTRAGPHFNVGQTIVTDYIYKCNQVNYVDQPVVADKNSIKRIFFKFINF